MFSAVYQKNMVKCGHCIRVRGAVYLGVDWREWSVVYSRVVVYGCEGCSMVENSVV